MPITSVPIRATITLGDIIVKTPYILSFNVRKARNSKSTFSASLKIPADDLTNVMQNEIVIQSGVKGKETQIFKGYVLSSRPSNCFDDPAYIILNISGADALFKLEGQFFTRRVIDIDSQWGVIDSVVRSNEKGSQFKVVNEPVQIVDRYATDSEESTNKDGVSGSFETLGTELPSGDKMEIDFRFSAIQTIED